MDCPKCGLARPDSISRCQCGYEFAAEGHPGQIQDQASKTREKAGDPWRHAVMSGLAGAVVSGLAAGFGSGRVTFVVWFVCYLFFFSWLKPLNRKVVGIAIMIVVGVLISTIVRSIR